MLKKLFRHVSAPLGALTLAAALVPAAAQAQRVEFYGFGYVYNFNATCMEYGWSGRPEFNVRFRPGGVGDNGSQTNLSFYRNFGSFAVQLAEGNFDREWRTVSGTSSGGSFYMWPEDSAVRVQTQSPRFGRIRAGTNQVRMVGRIHNYDGIQDCDASFEATMIQRPPT
ncbi:hypothetical protein LCM17_16635 [Cereibacter sphaeroides]|nr:hypothetical protein [Cereibacter sphaeroides]